MLNSTSKLAIRARFFGMALAVASPFTVGLSNANAFCLQLTNFCGQMEVFTDIDGNAYGRWDWTCNGEEDPAEMLGESAGGGTAIVTGYIAAGALTSSWRINIPARTTDIWGFSDPGTTPPSLVQVGEPFTVVGLECIFGASPNADLPSVFD